ncbi:MAG: hypothetical protein HY720_33355, partial [Planctomycetes bacterium]|nr:hypothetical protein [Planctomycetota bacterium]
FHLVFDEAAKELRLEAKDGDEVVERYEVPPELVFLNHPGKITFHRDGRVTWPVPDTTLLGEKARDATASDITVRNTKTGALCAYDLDPGDIINFMMKDTPARK